MTGATASPIQLERQLETSAGRAREHLTSAAAYAGAVWDVETASDVEIEAAWTVTLRTAGAPAPAVQIQRIAGGLRATSDAGPAADFILARGDAIEHDGHRMWARGRRVLRLVVIAGADLADLARNRERVERRGLAAIGGERAQHARLIADFATTVASPDAASADAFEWAKAEADALLVDLPGTGRRLASTYRIPGTPDWSAEGPVIWAGAEQLASLGAALLSAGLREPVRDAIRGGARILEGLYHEWAGGAPAAPAFPPSVPDPSACWAPLLREMSGFWGAHPAGGARLDLSPVAHERSRAEVHRVRVGDAVLDAELHRRFDRVAVRLHRRHGPRLPVAVELRGPPPLAVTADDEPLASTRAVLVVADRHEVVFQF